MDTYKSETKLLDFFKYSLSVSLFSQLTAGPILNYRDGFSQFDQIGKKPFDYENLSRGISLFTVGLLKKVLLADSLATITSQLHHAISMGKELNTLESIGATWGFLLQLYFDFSAYSDMALGLGLCFGFTFPINFNSPLKATSFSDFISKWHMSLINFTRNYIFLPISKYVKKKAKGKAVRRQFIGWAVGLQASFLVINIWHSPTLMLILQGLVLGLFLIIVNVIGKSISRISITPKKTSIRIKRLKAVLGHFLVLSAASIFATFLRISNFNELSTLFHGFFRLPKLETDNTLLIETTSHFAYLISDRLVPSIQEPITLLGYQTLTIPTIPFLLLLTLIGIFGPNTMQAFGMVVHLEKKWYQNFLWRPSLKWGIFIGLALASYLMIAENTSSLKFLYE
ncbi:MBOAT family O-acyltransferase [uncultured Arcticibacterium sp.]|uniref:MBOAT family O-acyltransferase n=1 Tax=uncultured Arcticibacterium sp. TaxID=2173042 RepID=UPI0030F4D36F